MAKTAKKKTSAKADKSAAEAAVNTPESTPSEDASQLTIADLQAIASVIDAATRRGAFGASEAAEVGVIYNKLTTFLTTIASQQRELSEGAGE